jgi:RimJ/RimL family protein N-acetyltransferase
MVDRWINELITIIVNLTMELKGTNFSLREWRTSDTELLQKHANNPNVYNFLKDRFPHPYTMADAVSWVNMMLRQTPIVTFVIAVDDKLAGVIGLEMRDDIYRKAPLLGYWLGEEFWGRSIATEAVKLLTNYAFSTLDIVRIQAGVLGNNARSMRVLEKAGYVKEGVLKNNIFKDGLVLDEWVYGTVKRGL